MIELAIAALIAVIFVQQFHISKLVNKLMSKNYHDYVQSEVIAKDKPKEKIQPPDLLPEEIDDLGYLNSM